MQRINQKGLLLSNGVILKLPYFLSSSIPCLPIQTSMVLGSARLEEGSSPPSFLLFFDSTKPLSRPSSLGGRLASFSINSPVKGAILADFACEFAPFCSTIPFSCLAHYRPFPFKSIFFLVVEEGDPVEWTTYLCWAFSLFPTFGVFNET